MTRRIENIDKIWLQKYLSLSGATRNAAFFFFFFLFLTNIFIYLFLAALGLRCCTQAFSSCGKRGLLFVAVSGLLIAVTSVVAEHGL